MWDQLEDSQKSSISKRINRKGQEDMQDESLERFQDEEGTSSGEILYFDSQEIGNWIIPVDILHGQIHKIVSQKLRKSKI